MKYKIILFTDYEEFDLNNQNERIIFESVDHKNIYDIIYTINNHVIIIKDENKKRDEYHYKEITDTVSEEDFKNKLISTIPYIYDVFIISYTPKYIQDKLLEINIYSFSNKKLELNYYTDEKYKNKCVIQYLINRFKGKEKKFGTVNEMKICM